MVLAEHKFSNPLGLGAAIQVVLANADIDAVTAGAITTRFEGYCPQDLTTVKLVRYPNELVLELS